MSKIKTTISIFIAAILAMGVSIFVPSLLSQPAHAKFNDCSSGSTVCGSGGSGSQGGGGGGHGSIDFSSGDASFSGGSGSQGGGGGGHCQGNIYGQINCVGK
jgi:hypothetical protein